MAAKYWLKLYYEMLDDPKIGQLRPALRWRFIECLLVAGECDDGGYIPSSAEYAWRVRSDAEIVDTELTELASAGLLSRDSGRWLVTRFAKRQAAVTDAERMKRFRERKRKAEYDNNDTQKKPDSYDTVTKRNTDIDKIRIDTYTEEAQTHSGTIYELPEDAEPFSDNSINRQEMVSIISGVVKDTLAVGINDSDFKSVAEALINQGASQNDVSRFTAYWNINGYYKGKPALKTLVQEIKNSMVANDNKVNQPKDGGVYV